MTHGVVGAQLGIEKMAQERGQNQQEDAMLSKMLESMGPERVGSILNKLGVKKPE